MSSDLQLKKLRGSGGFIMARVSDEEQMKGNLGGPDLFLAPIGRLDEERISRYTCNTCEKEFEGGPKIEYENPNEEVAENLILIERGQYMCTNCGTTIAEYREFKKSDESGEIGEARSLDSTNNTSIQDDVQQEVIIPETTPQNQEAQEVVEQTQETYQQTQEAESNLTFNFITGMTVYDEDAKLVGIVKQVGIDANNSVVIIVSDQSGNDSTVKWDRIGKVGDIIILGESVQTSGNAQQGMSCKNCNFENKPESKFCEQCGSKI